MTGMSSECSYCREVKEQIAYNSTLTGAICKECHRRHNHIYCDGAVIYPKAQVYGIIANTAWAVGPRDGQSHREVVTHISQGIQLEVLRQTIREVLDSGQFHLEELGLSTDGTWPDNDKVLWGAGQELASHLVGYLRYSGTTPETGTEPVDSYILAVGNSLVNQADKTQGYLTESLYGLYIKSDGTVLKSTLLYAEG